MQTFKFREIEKYMLYIWLTIIHVLNTENQKSISSWIHDILVLLGLLFISLYISNSENIEFFLVSTILKFGAMVNVFGRENIKCLLAVSYNKIVNY